MNKPEGNLRPLLSRPEKGGWASGGPKTHQDAPKRTLTIAACESCRRKKAKCDGIRPRCTACMRRGHECRYLTKPLESHALATKRELSELKRKYRDSQNSHTHLERIFHLIKTLPEADAAAIVKRIRAGTDLETIALNVSDGNLLLQLRLIPETKYRYEFPWRKQMPAFLLRQDNPYLQPLMHEGEFAYPPDGSINPSQSGKGTSQYLKPLAAAKMVDPRMGLIKPSSWTLVCDDDVLMKDILHSFFLYEYSWVTCFHKDDFLDDMAAGRTEFCSSLLVNALLAFACHCHLALSHRAEFWNPQALGYKFLAEAKRLWEFETYSAGSLPTIQAAMLFHVQYVMSGLEKLAQAYMAQAIDMSHQLRLSQEWLEGESIRYKRSRAITLWSIFWTESLVAFNFKRAPAVEFPPLVGLPDPREDRAWYGEVWLNYPMDSILYPMQHPSAFKARVDFGLLLNRMAVTLYGAKKMEPATLSAHIYGFALDMNRWYRALPDELLPRNIVYPAHFRIHIRYLQIVMELQALMVTHHVPPMAIPPATDVISSSTLVMNCFETLVRVSYLRHGSERSDVLSTQSLHIIAFSALNQLKDATSLMSRSQIDDIRSSLILAAKGLYDQGRNWYFSTMIFHLLLGSMCQEDRDLLLRLENIDATGQESSEGRLKLEYVQSQFPVNLAKPTDDPEGRRLGNLLKQTLSLGRESGDVGRK